MATVREAIEIDGHNLSLSNRDKVLWPEDGYTKGDLVAYYRAVAPFIIPYLRDRPLTLERYPNGIDQTSFFEKQAPRGLPDWIPTVAVPTESGRRATTEFMTCNDEAALVYVANLAAIVLHVWTSRVQSLETPDFMLFDLDPYQCTLATLAKVALQFRDSLAEIGLEPLVKTTGGKGLHAIVPLAPRYDYATVKQFAELVANRVHTALPELTTFERSLAKRPKGTVMLDWVQVGMGKTMVAPFSVRERPKAPVSFPIPWSEVEAMARKRAKETAPEMARWTIKNVPGLLARNGDVWQGGAWKGQRLEPALKAARTRWE